MSGDHNKYQKPDYVDRRQWNYDPMTGEPLIDGWPLYSGLPRREWQGLTDEEVLLIAKRFALSLAFPYEGQTTPEMFARAIEAKLKEKNNG